MKKFNFITLVLLVPFFAAALAAVGEPAAASETVIVMDESGSMKWPIAFPEGFEGKEECMSASIAQAELSNSIFSGRTIDEVQTDESMKDELERYRELNNKLHDCTKKLESYLRENGLDKRSYIKIDSAKAAVSKLAELIGIRSEVSGEENLVGLVLFSYGGAVRAGLTSDTDSVVRKISYMGIGFGGTNTGAGLQAALDNLESVGYSNASIILLTDGMTNEGLTDEEILETIGVEAQQKGIKICTIGFGVSENAIDKAFLTRLAEVTGCSYSFAASSGLLSKEFIETEHEKAGTVLAEQSGEIAEGEIIDFIVNVLFGAEELFITVDWPGSDIDIKIIDPYGKELEVDGENVRIEKASGLLYAAVKNPAPGRYTIKIEGKEVPEGKMYYNAIASASGNLQEFPPIDFNIIVIGGVVVVVVIIAVLFFVLKGRGKKQVKAIAVKQQQ